MIYEPLLLRENKVVTRNHMLHYEFLLNGIPHNTN